ncbi:CHASE2 domain-containing protein [Aromatoleum diolicum]|uniref:CHASE2 domain-containing protein n=1 Tax=Aromatoleum diolicum TaxID=75796 RepID=A0ABX1Q9T2_9RHOO|nr:CHASE2 domain-containing protein [Aromatoleum diolicum]NMG74262.1 CHASE2 domain-containing protein [Aromatoleum diolicum]
MAEVTRIFLSYRRDDATVHTELIYRELADYFGADRVFMDIEKIGYGDDFRKEIEERIADCTVLLVMITPRWATMEKDGIRRLDDPDDYVRLEIASALRQGKRVIPVLLEGAQMPHATALPADISALPSLNAPEISGRRLKADLANLIAAIEKRGLANIITDLVVRMKLRRLAWWIAPSVAIAMFFAAWTALFDFLTLDTKMASYTMALGNVLRESPVDKRLEIVAIDAETERKIGRPFDRSWRREHAQLIDALSRAGARVIAFDIFLGEPGPDDEMLVEAIRAAKQNGTAVVFGTRTGSPSRIAELTDVVAGTGMLCAGTRLGYATVVPLAVRGKQDVIALGLLAAEPNSVVEEIDTRSGTILLRTPAGLKRIAYSLDEVLTSGQKACPILEKGDAVAQLIVDFRPPDQLARRRHRYEELVQNPAAIPPDAFKDRIVLVGSEARDDRIAVLRGLTTEERGGYEVHADTLNTILHGTRIHPLDPFDQFLIMIAMGGLGVTARLAGVLKSRPLRWVYLVGVPLLYFAASLLLYVEADILLNQPYHISAFFIAYVALVKIARRMRLLETRDSRAHVAGQSSA